MIAAHDLATLLNWKTALKHLAEEKGLKTRRCDAAFPHYAGGR